MTLPAALSINAQAQNADFKEMVASAIKAPSGHNTQPWKFKLLETAIEVHPDFEYALPVVDGNHKELYISIGCAVENLCIAANNKGYRATPVILKIEDSTYIVNVDLAKQSGTDNPLIEQIEKRQTNRSIYFNRIISTDKINLLQNITSEQSISLYFYPRGELLFNTIADYVYNGNIVQMNDKAFKNELLHWIRFNKAQAEQTRNGLTNKAMGSPSTPSYFGRLILKFKLNPKSQNKSDKKKIDSSSHLVLFTTKNNTPEEWIRLGCFLERFLLETTHLGIAIAYMNQPCEVLKIATEMQFALPIHNEYSTILVRMGYATPMPYSPRKSVDSFIIK